MRGDARRRAQQRLARAQRQVSGQIQRPLRACADDAAKLFKQRVRIQLPQGAPQGLAVPLKPAHEGGECHLTPAWHPQRFHQLAVAQKLGLLRRVVITMGFIQGARRLRQIGRVRDVKHLARSIPQLGQRDGCFAGSSGTHDHDRGRQATHRLLRVVKQDRLVKQLEFGVPGLQPAQGHGACQVLGAWRTGSAWRGVWGVCGVCGAFGGFRQRGRCQCYRCQRGRFQFDFGLIDRHTAQET